MSDPLSLTPVSLVVLRSQWFFPQLPRLFFFLIGEAASVVKPSSSVVYSGLVTSVLPLRGGAVPLEGGTPVAVTEEVANGTKGFADADRVLLICPSHRDDSLLLCLRRTLCKSSFSNCFKP